MLCCSCKGIAGSEENFAEIMNEKASEIGMTQTNLQIHLV